MRIIPERTLVESVVEALIQSDRDYENDIEPYSYYEEKAKYAIEAYETYHTAPREKTHRVEGLVFL